MRQTTRHQLWIAAIAAIVFFLNLGATRLWDQDEAFFARTAVEMHQRGEWVVPYFNDELFAHKPPLMFWMMRIGFLLFGVTEFAARFWSAAFGLATALLVYRLGRRMLNANVGLWAGLAMCTALMFDVVARAATPDSILVFFSTLALYIFVRQERWDDEILTATPNLPLPVGEGRGEGASPLPWTLCIAMYAVMGIAVLVKGPIGILLPGAVLGLYLLVRDPTSQPVADGVQGDRLLQILLRFTPARILRTMWSMRPWTALAAMLVVAGPWFALVSWRTGGAFFQEFIGVHNVGRFVGAMDNHSGGVWYYLPAILVGFFPWSIFGIPTALDLVRRCRGNQPWRRGAKFIACWIVVYVGFFSLAGTKLPSYVLPAYPALALATACFIDRWLTQPAGVHRWWPRLSFGSLLLIGLATAIAMPVMVYYTVDGQPLVVRLGIAPELSDDLAWVGWLGVILAAGGVAGLVLAELRHRREAMLGMAVTATAFCVTLLAGAAVRVDRHQPSPAVADCIHRHAAGTPQVAQFGYFRPSLVYYLDTSVTACKTPQRVAEFLGESTNSFLVTTEEHFARLAAQLPADVIVLDRRPEFPRSGAVLILGRKPAVAQRTDDARK